MINTYQQILNRAKHLNNDKNQLLDSIPVDALSKQLKRHRIAKTGNQDCDGEYSFVEIDNDGDLIFSTNHRYETDYEEFNLDLFFNDSEIEIIINNRIQAEKSKKDALSKISEERDIKEFQRLIEKFTQPTNQP